MTTAPALPPAGWYPDPHLPGTHRWWDGVRWTEHVGEPAVPHVGGQWAAAPSSDGVLRWLLPVGRTWQSIAAGYVALFAVVLWVLGPVALVLGLLALRASGQGRGGGRGRAWFAVVVGGLVTVGMVLYTVLHGW